MANKSILLPILSTFNSTGTKQAVSALGSLGVAVKNAAKSFLQYQMVVGAINFTENAVKEAANLQQNMTAMPQVFGDATASMKKFAEGASSIGMSTSEAAKATIFMGSVLRGAGYGFDEAASKSKILTKLAADMAVTYGYDVQEALTGISAMFRGEYDPIEKFGVAIKQSQINAEMAARGLNKLTGSALTMAQQQVRFDLLMKASTATMGAYQRQSESLAVAQANLTATFKNFEASAGSGMLKPLANLFNQMKTTLDSNTGSVVALGNGIGGLMSALTPLMNSLVYLFTSVLSLLGGLAKGITPMATIFGTVLTAIITYLADVISKMSKWIDIIVRITAVVATMYGAWRLMTVIFTVIEGFTAFIATVNGLKAATIGATWAQIAFDTALEAINPAAIGFALAATAILLGTAFTPAVDEATVALNKYDMSISNALSATQGFRDYMSRPADIKPNVKPVTPEKTIRPLNPKPGETYTFWKLEGGLYVWYEQVWDGKHWSKAKKMTYTPPAKEVTPAVESAADKRRKAAIKKQKDDYKSLAQSVKDSFASIQESIMGAFDITSMGSSATRMMSNVRRLIEQTKKFAETIKGLSAAGLNSDLLNQLIMAGPQAAGRLASNLLASGQVGNLNAAYGEYGSLASQLATTGVKSAYGVGGSQYNITIGAGLGSKEQIAKAVVEAIKFYEKSNGTGWRA